MTMHDHTGHTHSYGDGSAVGMILITGAILLLVLLAFAFVWTPWAVDDVTPGQGGGDDGQPQQEQQTQPQSPSGPQVVPQAPSVPQTAPVQPSQ